MAMTFYATNEDLKALTLRFFQIPGIKLFQEYSAPDQQNLWFEKPDDIAQYLSDGARSFAAWPSGVGGSLIQKHIEFTKDLQQRFGEKGRTVIESPAIIRVQPVTNVSECLNPFAISCWTEKGARQRSMYSEETIASVDWNKIKTTVASIERWIKKHSPARLHSYPVMPNAYSELTEGEALFWNFGEKIDKTSLYLKLADGS